jgi:ABC-type proline/glycine betaine transport system permease subunit
MKGSTFLIILYSFRGRAMYTLPFLSMIEDVSPRQKQNNVRWVSLLMKSCILLILIWSPFFSRKGASYEQATIRLIIFSDYPCLKQTLKAGLSKIASNSWNLMVHALPDVLRDISCFFYLLPLVHWFAK